MILCLSGFSGGHGLLIFHKLIVILVVGVVVDFDWGLLCPIGVEEVLRHQVSGGLRIATRIVHEKSAGSLYALLCASAVPEDGADVLWVWCRRSFSLVS